MKAKKSRITGSADYLYEIENSGKIKNNYAESPEGNDLKLNKRTQRPHKQFQRKILITGNPES